MAHPHDIIFSTLGPFNRSNSIAFTQQDSLLDLEKVNSAVQNPDKTFIIFKGNFLNKVLAEGKLSFSDLSSPKTIINIEQYDEKAHNVELIHYQSAAEGGGVSRLKVTHQFADAGHADVRKITFKAKNSDGKVDEFESEHTSEDKTFLDKVKNFFHLSNLDGSNSGNAIRTSIEDAADDWATGLIQDLQKFDANLVVSAVSGDFKSDANDTHFVKSVSDDLKSPDANNALAGSVSGDLKSSDANLAEPVVSGDLKSLDANPVDFVA